jgi:hypothetical protein
MKITKSILKQMIAEEMANAGVVNEEDKCAKIRAKEEELFLMSKHYEVEGYGFESYKTLQDARELRKANKECFPEQMSEVFQSGLHTMEPSKALEHYQETVKDYRVVAGKIQQMLPEEQKMGEGEEAVNITEVAIEEMMKLVEFVLENKGMSQQQKDEVLEKAEDLNYEGEAVLKVLKIVRETPEELEDLVRELYRKYEVAEKYLRGILEPEYTGIDPTDADLEDMGKQMGLGLQEQNDLDEGFTNDTMTPEEKKKGIERHERMLASEKERLKKSLARAENDVQRAQAQRTYKRNKEQHEKMIARLRGEAVPAKPDPDAINPDFDRDRDEYSRVYQESKKDLLKRIVAEELAKMEIAAMEESGELDEITYSADGIDFSGKDKGKDSITLDDMSVRGILGRMGNDSVEGQQAKDAMDKYLARHQGRAAKREQNKRDQFSAVKDAEERRFIGAAQKRAREQRVKIQGIRDSMKDGDLTREEAVYIMSLDGSDDLKDYNDDAVQPRDKIGS